MPGDTRPRLALGRRERALLLVAVCALALLPRLYSAQQLGRDWYYPGSFTLVNFDEGGSCRAALGGFDYSPWVGWQTIALASLAGAPPGPTAATNPTAAKAYCHSAAHLGVARGWSALLGALSAGLTVWLGWQLFPSRPGIGVLAGALLALSGWHVAASHSATVDAPSVFCIYLFLIAAVAAVAGGGLRRWLMALALLVPALWTKYWVFALLSLLAACPLDLRERALQGLSRARQLLVLLALGVLFGCVCNPALPAYLRWCLPPLFYLCLPWRRMSPTGRLLTIALPWLAPLAMQSELFAAYTAGALESRFGSGYGAIGWHKWLRNALNIPLVLLIGLGLPGLLLALHGARSLWRQPRLPTFWLALLPLAAFFLYMLCLAPVTYYRHYLPLLPVACLFAAVGWSALSRPLRRALLLPLLAWQVTLAWDLVSDYHLDPRRRLPAWYAQTGPQRVLTSFYVNPPPVPGVRHRLFLPRDPAANAPLLASADALLLSENWYDTAFANELNGPLVSDPRRLIKTTPPAVHFYRDALAGRHPQLRLEAVLRAPTFMPELRAHRAAYGSFTQFVGDLAILRPRPTPTPADDPVSRVRPGPALQTPVH